MDFNLVWCVKLTKFINMKYIYISFLFLLMSCKKNKNYVPLQPQEMSDALYSTCVDKLKKACRNNDFYDIAFYIASLEGDRADVANNLEKAFEFDSNMCNEIFDIQNFANQGFFQSIYRYDTLLFKKYFTKCNSRENAPLFLDYMNEVNRSYNEKLASRPQIDSMLRDDELIIELTKIGENDQHYRKLVSGLNNSQSDMDNWYSEMVKLDSINLIKIDSILKLKEYPKPESVGYELSRVPFFVIHHQPLVPIRLKYRNYLEKNCNSGLMSMFDRRTKELSE